MKKNSKEQMQQQCESLIGVFDSDLEKLQQRIGIDRSPNTYSRQLQIRNTVANYIVETMQVTDIPLEKLTPAFIYDFSTWLSIKRHYRTGTIWLTCQQLKSVVSRAFQKGLMPNNPFYRFHAKKTIRPRQYLTQQELQQVIRLSISDALMARHRDLFVFSALTGIAFVDICRLKATDIYTINGEAWISAQRQKTHTPYMVRLLPRALRILQANRADNDPIFGPICYRTVAKHIPIIIEACGIQKHITFHCARHSFAVASLSAGMPIESISRILGHSNIATTQIYARITTEKLSADMDKLQAFCDKCV